MPFILVNGRFQLVKQIVYFEKDQSGFKTGRSRILESWEIIELQLGGNDALRKDASVEAYSSAIPPDFHAAPRACPNRAARD